jgi:hypothetical protein
LYSNHQVHRDFLNTRYNRYFHLEVPFIVYFQHFWLDLMKYSSGHNALGQGQRYFYVLSFSICSHTSTANKVYTRLMLIPCIIRRIRNGQQYELICNIPLLYILAPTCFGSSLPSSGSFFNPSELLEIQIETTTIRHTGHVTTHYMIYHTFDLYFKELRRI